MLIIHMSCGDEFCPEERSKTSLQKTQVLFYLLTFNLKWGFQRERIKGSSTPAPIFQF